MIDTRMIQQCCDLLGWPLWDGSRDLVGLLGMPPVTVCSTSRGLVVHRWAPDKTQAIETIDVDLTTLLIAALVRHAGPVDVGPCPACEGSRRWEGDEEAPWIKCPACREPDSYGKPTGRHVVDATEVVLMSAPRDVDGHGRGVDETEAQADAVWEMELEGVDASTVRMGESRRDGRMLDATFYGRAPGHEGAREALRRLAEEWREHLPVLGDWAIGHGKIDVAIFAAWASAEKSSGRIPSLAQWMARFDLLGFDCPHVPRSLAECPAVARWLLAWLDGECGECDGAGEGAADEGPYGPCSWCAGSGSVIGPHIPAIRGHINAAWRRDRE